MNSTDENCCKVPKGWIREEVIRKNGVNKGKIDIYIKSPRGKIFRSKKELVSYIEKNKLSYSLQLMILIFLPRKRSQI